MKDIIKGAIITLVIGGSAYTFSTADVVQNFAEDTGLSQEQAEQYISEVDEDDLASFDMIGSQFVSDGQQFLDLASEIDCTDNEYEWESISLSCKKAKEQVGRLARSYIALGNVYIRLVSDSASRDDMSEAISLIDQLNSDLESDIVPVLLDLETIDEEKKTNSYNKAVLKAALESE